MQTYKLETFLYLPLDYTIEQSMSIVHSRMKNAEIEKYERRDGEIAVKFNNLIHCKTIQDAERIFLELFEDYDVDNYVIIPI